MKASLAPAEPGRDREAALPARWSAAPPDPTSIGRISSGARRRNAAATREAILTAAKHRFLNAGYEQVGLREIAADAAADPSLVSRYFGSKEDLFLAVVEALGDCSDLTSGPRSDFGRRASQQIFGDDADGVQMAWLGLMVQSASSPKAAEILRDASVERFFRPLAEWIGGPAAEPKADLIASLLMGLVIIRQAKGVTAPVPQTSPLPSMLVAQIQSIIDA